jgi:hypothetical protein
MVAGPSAALADVGTYFNKALAATPGQTGLDAGGLSRAYFGALADNRQDVAQVFATMAQGGVYGNGLAPDGLASGARDGRVQWDEVTKLAGMGAYGDPADRISSHDFNAAFPGMTASRPVDGNLMQMMAGSAPGTPVNNPSYGPPSPYGPPPPFPPSPYGSFPFAPAPSVPPGFPTMPAPFPMAYSPYPGPMGPYSTMQYNTGASMMYNAAYGPYRYM